MGQNLRKRSSMKKKQPIPFDQLIPTVSELLSAAKKKKKNFDGPSVDYTAPPVRIKDDVNDKYILCLEKLDDWCEKWLDKNKDAKVVRGEYYPYKDYTAIDELLRKYGKELIERVVKECPIKNKEVKHEIYDSLAFNIYRKKVDPKSLISVPNHGSFWDRISDRGHA